MPGQFYTVEMVEFLRVGYLSMRLPALTKAFNSKFCTNKSKGQIRAALKNRGITCGRTGRLKPGNVPWNAGTAGQGVCQPNSGTFRKDNVPGNVKPMWTERVNKDGFIEIKVPVTNPYTKAKTRFMHKHVWIWEQAHGPVPKGHVIRFLDGDKENCVLENLGMFTRTESLQMTREGFSAAPEDLKPAIMAIARLDTKRRERDRCDKGLPGYSDLEEQVLDIAGELAASGQGFRAADIKNARWPGERSKELRLGIHHALFILHGKGLLRRVETGLYVLAEKVA